MSIARFIFTFFVYLNEKVLSVYTMKLDIINKVNKRKVQLQTNVIICR